MNWRLVAVLLLGLVIRVLLMSSAYHVDIKSQAEWGAYVANAGSKNLYDYNVWTFSWPNHPPLTSLYYGWCYQIFRQTSLRLHQSVYFFRHFNLNVNWYNKFVDSFDRLVSPETPFSYGFLLSLKIIPILADLMIGLVIYLIAKNSAKRPLVYLVAYLFMPFSWYLSAMWGQTDQLAFLFVVAAFLLIIKHPRWSIVLLFIGGSIKPTSIYLLPIYFFYLVKVHKLKPSLIVGLLISVGLGVLVFNQFGDNDIWQYASERIIPRVLDRPARLTTNSFNFWHILVGNQAVSSNTPLPFVSGKVLGVVFYALINVLAVRKFRKTTNKNIVGVLFTVAMGSWLFSTDMLERYAFAGIVSGLMLTIYKPNLFKYWLVTSLIFWFNLYHGWWVPEGFYSLKTLVETSIFGRFVSIINVVIYLTMVFNKNEA